VVHQSQLLITDTYVSRIVQFYFDNNVFFIRISFTAIEESNMKIAISSEGTDLKAQVGNRFGASPYLIIADLGTGNFVDSSKYLAL